MHDAAYQFVTQAAAALGTAPGAVLELGSYNVNGSVRPLFRGAARYHGVDVRPGPCVDEVADAATYDGAGAYDVVVTTEMLEHAPDPAACIRAAWRSLRPGGVLILTAAGPGRAPHSCDGWPAPPPGEHYANITRAALADWLAGWRDVAITVNAAAGDVYATAVRP